MQFYQGHPTDGLPYKSDANQRLSITGAPTWFTRGSLHRAIFVKAGPFEDELGIKAAADEVLVRFEVKQPPAGTIKAIEDPYPQTFAILQRNTTMIPQNALIFRNVDPARVPKPGDNVAIWFSIMTPAKMIGVFRSHDEPGRSNLGGTVKGFID